MQGEEATQSAQNNEAAEQSSTIAAAENSQVEQVGEVKQAQQEEEITHHPDEAGITADGKRFRVPETYDCIEVLTDVRKWTEIPVMIEVLTILILFTGFFMGVPSWVFLIIYVFWRLCYNLGLGYILHIQSNGRHFSLFIERLLQNERFRAFFEQNISTKEDVKRAVSKYGGRNAGQAKLFHIDNHPLDFNAWMAYRAIVDIVLVNDLISYILFSISYLELPAQIGLLEVLQIFIGLLLIVFNVWAKSDAHRVLGDFAWYWGDFFFLVEKDLTFDGIFQMFPHPMYTVGYSFYYGLSMITRSYTVLIVSFMAHMLQLSFLVFAENPHIDKTYGVMTQSKDPVRDKILSEYFDQRHDLIMLKNLDIFKASDAFLVLIMIYNVILLFANMPWYFYVGQVIVWRLFHTVGIGYILTQQSKTKFWTNHWDSKRDAFENWKRLFNASLTMNHLVFILCAIKLFIMPSDWSWSGYLVKNMCGCVLIALNIWGSSACYEVIGDYGWFYGDFFIDEIPVKLQYHGIYRYLNNPELILGFAAYYGLALISHNGLVFALAFFSQVFSGLFYKLVEKPNMQSKYGKEHIRLAGGIEQEIKTKLKKTKIVTEWSAKFDKLKQHLEELQQNPNGKTINEFIQRAKETLVNKVVSEDVAK